MKSNMAILTTVFGLMLSNNAFSAVNSCTGEIKIKPTEDGDASITNPSPINFTKVGDNEIMGRAGSFDIQFVEYTNGSRGLSVLDGEELVFLSRGQTFDGAFLVNKNQFADIKCN